MNTIAASYAARSALRGDIALKIQCDFFLKTGRIAIALSEIDLLSSYFRDFTLSASLVTPLSSAWPSLA
ncbi:MAG: hypothetical protein ACREUM_00325, partial [Nitrosospira sp.]